MAAPRKAKRSSWYVYVAALAGAAALAAVLFHFQKTPSPPAGIPGPARASSDPAAMDASVFKDYGGSESCNSCHETECRLWRESHHGLAERRIDASLDAA